MSAQDFNREVAPGEIVWGMGLAEQASFYTTLFVGGRLPRGHRGARRGLVGAIPRAVRLAAAVRGGRSGSGCATERGLSAVSDEPSSRRFCAVLYSRSWWA